MVVNASKAAMARGLESSVDVSTARDFVEAFDGLVRAIIVPNSHKAAHAIQMGPQDVRCLIWLGEKGACLMSEFAKGVGVPLSTATHLANRLVEKGVVQRDRADNDRRSVHVMLSPSGRKMHARFFEQRLNRGLQILARLEDKERRQLVALMQKALTTA